MTLTPDRSWNEVLREQLDFHYRQLFRPRLEGLTDEEYLWEPAPGSWTIRPRPDGRWVVDSALPAPTPEPFTTLAWRLWHIIDCYGEDRAHRWLGIPPQGAAIGIDGDWAAVRLEEQGGLRAAHAR